MAWRVRTGTIGKTLDRCQDSVRCCELPDGCVVLIVADGSGEHGDLASAYVADSAIARSMKIESIRRERNPARIVEELIDSVVADYERWILQGTLERREHRSTLGIVLLYDDFVVFGGVGDVFFCLLCDTDVFFFNHGAQRGEYANEASFVDASATIHVERVFEPDSSGLVLTTDGLEKWVDIQNRSYQGAENIPVAVGQHSGVFTKLVAAARTAETDALFELRVRSMRLQRAKNDDIGVSVAFR